MSKPVLWIVIPCYNEEQVLPITALESVWLAPSISDITSTLIVSGFLAFEWRRLRAAEAGEGSNGLHRA